MTASTSYVFGPVASRRLGLSLGIDLLDFKTCSMNCIYCELGLTTNLSSQRRRSNDYRQALAQVEHRLSQLQRPPDALTLAGSGEPCLHLDLGRTLQGLRDLTPIKTVVLTNSSLIPDPTVRRELAHADIVIPSLDAASQEVFIRVNRPAPGIMVRDIVRGLAALRQEFQGQIWLETLLVQGVNDAPAELEKLRAAIKFINPDLLQLNTIVRPPAEKEFLPVSNDRLQKIAQQFDLPVEISGARPLAPAADSAEAADIIIHTTRMRPCTIDDLAQISGLDLPALRKMLTEMQEQGKVRSLEFDQRLYFRGLR
jgi:wyosine [tRNA(Phe)-imidazoG37] synthetase (radical SAM superfamily)